MYVQPFHIYGDVHNKIDMNYKYVAYHIEDKFR